MWSYKNLKNRPIVRRTKILLFLHAHREASALAHEIPKESGQFRFLRAACLANIKGTLGLILVDFGLPSSFLLCVLPKRRMMGPYSRVLPAFSTLE
jgi:hypothetical protein